MDTPRLVSTAAVVCALAGAAPAQTPPSGAPTASPAPAAAAPATVPGGLALTPSGDIVGTLKASGQFTILLKALNVANLTDLLEGPGPFTLLAPTDTAFKAMPPARLAALMSSPGGMQALLNYHLVAVRVPPAKLSGGKTDVTTAAGPSVMLDGVSTPMHVNSASIVGQATVSNGDLYALDQVLSPPSAQAAATLAQPVAAETGAAPR